MLIKRQNVNQNTSNINQRMSIHDSILSGKSHSYSTPNKTPIPDPIQKQQQKHEHEQEQQTQTNMGTPCRSKYGGDTDSDSSFDNFPYPEPPHNHETIGNKHAMNKIIQLTPFHPNLLTPSQTNDNNKQHLDRGHISIPRSHSVNINASSINAQRQSLRSRGSRGRIRKRGNVADHLRNISSSPHF